MIEMTGEDIIKYGDKLGVPSGEGLAIRKTPAWVEAYNSKGEIEGYKAWLRGVLQSQIDEAADKDHTVVLTIKAILGLIV